MRSATVSGTSGTATYSTVHSPALRTFIDAAAIVFSMIFVAAGVTEILRGGLSPERLLVTYVAESAISSFVVALNYSDPSDLPVGLFGAIAYACSHVFFTSTAVCALANNVLRLRQPTSHGCSTDLPRRS